MRKPLSEAEVLWRLPAIPGWEAEGNQRLVRKLAFRDHIEAMGFVTRLAIVAEVMDHHPDLRIVYNRVEVVLSTHDVGAVTDRDFDLAARVNGLLGQT
ncbi:MAG: 4a-hydroxytetrahydrobiopterin dehydratase [Anaerolinea sp.]|nr:4a-hydroxytetrahydrobiopterin dehydratase [Anaerolinea sp.]